MRLKLCSGVDIWCIHSLGFCQENTIVTSYYTIIPSNQKMRHMFIMYSNVIVHLLHFCLLFTAILFCKRKFASELKSVLVSPVASYHFEYMISDIANTQSYYFRHCSHPFVKVCTHPDSLSPLWSNLVFTISTINLNGQIIIYVFSNFFFLFSPLLFLPCMGEWIGPDRRGQRLSMLFSLFFCALRGWAGLY